MDILAPSTVTLDAATRWLERNASAGILVSAAEFYWQLAPLAGLRPEILLAQAVKETGWGRYGGVIDASWNNFAGIKVADPANASWPDVRPVTIPVDKWRTSSDWNPNAHQRFGFVRDGVRGHVNHVIAYVFGWDARPIGEPHPRFTIIKAQPWAGSVRTTQQLGQHWSSAQSTAYGDSLDSMVREMEETTMTKAVRYPGAVFNSDGSTPGLTIVPVQLIIHCTAIEGDAHPHDGLEWHLENHYDGYLEQLVEFNRRADAQNQANRFLKDGVWCGAISMECWGLGDGWLTAAQIQNILDVARFLNTEWGVPLDKCLAWDDPGIGWHTLFPQWMVTPKSCPGINRKSQIDTVVLPALAGGVSLSPIITPPTQEFNMILKIRSCYRLYLGFSDAEIDANTDTGRKLRQDIDYHRWMIETRQRVPAKDVEGNYLDFQEWCLNYARTNGWPAP